MSHRLDVSGQIDDICSLAKFFFWSLSFFFYIKILYALKFQQLPLENVKPKKYELANEGIKPINHWTLTLLKVVKPYKT